MVFPTSTRRLAHHAAMTARITTSSHVLWGPTKVPHAQAPPMWTPKSALSAATTMQMASTHVRLELTEVGQFATLSLASTATHRPVSLVPTEARFRPMRAPSVKFARALHARGEAKKTRRDVRLVPTAANSRSMSAPLVKLRLDLYARGIAVSTRRPVAATLARQVLSCVC